MWANRGLRGAKHWVTLDADDVDVEVVDRESEYDALLRPHVEKARRLHFIIDVDDLACHAHTGNGGRGAQLDLELWLLSLVLTVACKHSDGIVADIAVCIAYN